MKKLFLFSLLFIVVSALYAQTKPVVKKATVKPVASPTVLKSVDDSASYAVGLSVANFYKQQGITQLNSTLVSKAINDVLAGKPSLFDDATANAVMNRYMAGMQERKSKPNIDAGNKFLAANKLKPGIKTTASGLQYEVISEGSGARPSPTDSVTCNYKGTLLNGTVFDDSYSRGQPATFALDHVINGWREGIPLMPINSKYKFYVPYNLAYGAFDYGPIPGGSMLTFEVELLAIKKGTPATTQPTQPVNQ